MTNDEYFNDKPMKEALAKWRDDCAKGFYGDIQEWLKSPFMDFSKGKVVRGRFYAYDWIEEKISKMESLKVTGYLLEWRKDGKGAWLSSEFEPLKGGSGGNRNDLGDAVSDDWFNNEIEVGFFKALPDTWLGDSDDWDIRLGVAFDSRTTPTENPKADGTWEGVSVDMGELWRVRKVTIEGALSDKAKDYIRRNPDVYFTYAS